MLGRLARGIGFILVVALFAPHAPAPARAPEPLFAADEMIRLTLRGPLAAIRRGAERSTDSHPATLALQGANPESHAIRLSARGLSRRRRDVCAFPPLRLEFAGRPAAGSLFRGQRRLKLVTHCQPGDDFQQHVLLEYAAYRLLNALSPRSLRVRLARTDYVEGHATTPFVTRLGFLIEDVDHAARRNGLVELDTGNVAVARLSPSDAARFAVFQYMIGNLDWAMNGGPAGEPCCHNGKLLAADRAATANLIPIPYDFDYSGLVEAPYAVVPEQVPVASVRTRRYRGFCLHNAEAQAAAAQFRAARPQLEAVMAGIPELERRRRERALSYLRGFFDDIATPQAVASNLLRTCLR